MTGTALSDTPALRAQNEEQKRRQQDRPVVTAAGSNSFTYAAYLGDMMELERLYNYFGCDILDAKNAGGINALMWAACQGHMDVAKFLLEKGADINVRDPGGHTLVERAVEKQHEEMASFLREWPRRVEIKAEAERAAAKAAQQSLNQREERISHLKQIKPKNIFAKKI